MAAAVDAIAPSVVQVHGRRRPVSGVVYASDIVVTNARALGSEDGVKVTTNDGRTTTAELAGWDPASGLAALRIEGLALDSRDSRGGSGAGRSHRAGGGAFLEQRADRERGHRRRHRRTAADRTRARARAGDPGHGAAARRVRRRCRDRRGGPRDRHRDRGADSRSRPSSFRRAIAWKSVAHVLEHGRPRTGFLGVSGHPVRLAERQRGNGGRDRRLLVIDVTAGGPADSGGVLIGDLILDMDQQPVGSADDLLSLLNSDRVGRASRCACCAAGRSET